MIPSDSISSSATKMGDSVRTAADSTSALAAIRARRPALLVQDIWMQGGGLDGLDREGGLHELAGLALA